MSAVQRSSLRRTLNDVHGEDVNARNDSGDADVDAKDVEDGKTALMIAVESSCVDSVRAVIDAGADVNEKDKNGETALFWACRFACNDILQLLIENNADVKVTNKDSQTALFCIEKCCCVWIYRDEFEDCKACACASVLLSNGIPVYTKDRFGDTALHCLVKKGITCACKLLIKKDRTLVYKKDKNDRTPIYYAILRFDAVGDPFDLARPLLDKMGASIVLDEALLVFWIEDCLNKHIELDSLISFVRDKRFAEELIYNAIWNFYACQIFNEEDHHSHAVEIANYLVSGNENSNEVLLILNWRERPVELLHLLNERGVNLNTVDSEGNTILHYSTLLPFRGVPQEIVMEIITLLCKSMNNISVRNNRKELPLLFFLSRAATEFRLRRNNSHEPERIAMVEVCQSLLGMSPADCNETNERGETVFHLIMKIFQDVLILNTASRALALDETMKLLELFSPLTITRGVTANKRDDENQNSPLHIWATLSLPSVQEYHKTDDRTFESVLAKILTHLLRCGAIVNATNLKKETPLHLCKTLTAAKLLIDNKARKNDLDSLECPPLLAAAHAKLFKDPNAKAKFYPDVIGDSLSFFKACRTEYGLELWAKDANGKSILSVLLECEEFELSQALVQLACEEVESELTNILEIICNDRSTHSYWKTTMIDNILKSAKYRVKPSKALCYCCINLKSVQCSNIDLAKTGAVISQYTPETNDDAPPLKRVKYEDSNDETMPSVHLEIAKRLLFYGVDEDERKALARYFPELQSLLTVHIDDSKIPPMIPWHSQSKVHKGKLDQVVRRQKFKSTTSCCYHEEPIGKGAFGYVFAGIRNELEVAMERIDKLTVAQQQIKGKIKNLINLPNDEHVVKYISFDEKEEDFAFICLELMEGNLDDYLESSHFDRSKNTSLCKQVLLGLQFLRKQKICHGDLKPQNILYKTHPELILKIANLGRSRNMDVASSYSEMTSRNVDTRGWIAPESVKSNSFTTCSDIFACGLVVHYIMSEKKHPFSPKECKGMSPVQVNAETVMNVLHHNMTGLDDSLHPETTNLLLKLLESNPNERPSAAKALDHPMFWSNEKKIDLLIAVGEEFRSSNNRTIRRTKHKLEKRFKRIVKHGSWNANDYAHMSEILEEVKRKDESDKKKRDYDVKKVEDLLIMLKNAKSHFVDQKCNPIGKYLLDDFVYLKNFPDLVMVVFEIVIETHKWDKSKRRIKLALRNKDAS